MEDVRLTGEEIWMLAKMIDNQIRVGLNNKEGSTEEAEKLIELYSKIQRLNKPSIVNPNV